MDSKTIDLLGHERRNVVEEVFNDEIERQTLNREMSSLKKEGSDLEKKMQHILSTLKELQSKNQSKMIVHPNFQSFEVDGVGERDLGNDLSEDQKQVKVNIRFRSHHVKQEDVMSLRSQSNIFDGKASRILSFLAFITSTVERQCYCKKTALMLLRINCEGDTKKIVENLSFAECLVFLIDQFVDSSKILSSVNHFHDQFQRFEESGLSWFFHLSHLSQFLLPVTNKLFHHVFVNHTQPEWRKKNKEILDQIDPKKPLGNQLKLIRSTTWTN